MESNRNDESGRRVYRRVMVGGLCLTALVALGVGCGQHRDEQASSSGSSQQLLVAQAAAPAQVGGAGQPQAVSATEEGLPVGTADSLPPDVAATVADTMVYAGGSVEITAQGSPDVVGVTLSDGIGRKQPFVYDAASDTWKVFYRVPIKSADRVGLSVTAKTASQRWRRVWLFLTVRHETPEAAQEAAPDTSSKQ